MSENRRSFLRTVGGALGVSFVGLLGQGCASNKAAAEAEGPLARGKADEEGFVSIFDGQSLDGWHVSAESGHSRASDHKSGGEWKVEKGNIVGSQDIPGNGGLVITDKNSYKDFEVALEMNNDFGPDSGLFLRCTEDGTAYQCNIDYRTDGTLGGIYGEGLGGNPNIENFLFSDNPNQITENKAPTPLPVRPESWTYFWRHGQWNEIRARIVGNPPKIITWVNGVKFMEWSDNEKRHAETGGIALQVHGGGNHVGEYVRYRNIRVKEL